MPVGSPSSDSEARPVAWALLDAMEEAGIDTAFLVLRRGKWDVPRRLSERGERAPRLAYVITDPTRSIPETLDRARPFVLGSDVLLGFPDVVFRPAGAVGALIEARRVSGADVSLALFPSERPDKTDMVDLEGDAVTGFRVKPGPCELVYTWILAAWGDRFTRFLGSYLAGTGGEAPPQSPLAELQMSQVLAAALHDGLTIGGFRFDDGSFIDVGTPEDLARATGRRPRR